MKELSPHAQFYLCAHPHVCGASFLREVLSVDIRTVAVVIRFLKIKKIIKKPGSVTSSVG